MSLAFVLILGALAQDDVAPAQTERTLFGRPLPVTPARSPEELARRRASFEQHLEDNDLVLSGDVLMPRAQLQGEIEPDYAWREPPHYATIFLNFFGGMLSSGTNAAENQAGCVGPVPLEYPAYVGSEATALAVIQVFEAAMDPYAVRIAYDAVPPAHLPYSMVMMGGSPEDLGMMGGILGVSCSSDCGDTWWRDSTFAFTEESGNASTLGNTALQEAAHAFGLDHIDGADHIMYPFAGSGTKTWANTCTLYNDATGGISCTFVHDEFCGEDGGMQNDDAELLAFFGPDAPDVQAPVVTIVEPADGTMLPSGGSFDVITEVTDDHVGVGWRLRVTPPAGDDLIQNAYQFETQWTLSGLPDGTYVVYIEAIDHDRNEGSAMVTVQIGEGGGTTSATTGVETTGPMDGSSSSADEASGSESPMTGDDPNPEKQCACTGGATGAGVVAPLLVVPIVRRRRRAVGRRRDQSHAGAVLNGTNATVSPMSGASSSSSSPMAASAN